MKYFVSQYGDVERLEIIAASAFDAANEFARRRSVGEGARIVTEGDGTRYFLFTGGILRPETAAPVAATGFAAPFSPGGTANVRELAAPLAENSFWIRTFAVMMALCCAMMIGMALLFLFSNELNRSEPQLAFVTGVASVFLALLMGGFALLYGWFSWLIFSTASGARKAAESGNSADLFGSIRSVATFLKANGIMVMVVLVIYGVVIVFAILGAMIGGSLHR